MEKIKNFRDLRIWQKGIEIVKDIYLATEEFPEKELYGLTSQMRRSAISIPSNIAEGFKRQYNKEYTQFLHISLGSAAELETQLTIAKELSFIKSEEFEKISEKLVYLSKMIASLLSKLK